MEDSCKYVMKQVINILLLITLIIVLGFIIINSGNMSYTYYPESTINVSKGVDFSNMNIKGHSIHHGNSFNNAATNSLIPESGYSYLASGSSMSPTGRPVASNRSLPTMGTGNSSYRFSSQRRSENQSGGGIGNNMLVPFGGSNKQNTSSSIGASSSLLAVNSALNANEGRNAAPFDPYLDYIENDITHPGGNPIGDPMGNSVPVGDGTLSFLLFISWYVLWIYNKK